MRRQALTKLLGISFLALIIFILSMNYYATNKANNDKLEMANGVTEYWDTFGKQSGVGGDTGSSSTGYANLKDHSSSVHSTNQASFLETHTTKTLTGSKSLTFSSSSKAVQSTAAAAAAAGYSTLSPMEEEIEEEKEYVKEKEISDKQEQKEQEELDSQKQDQSIDYFSGKMSTSDEEIVFSYFRDFFNILVKTAPVTPELTDYNKEECPIESGISYWGPQDMFKYEWLSYNNLMKCLKVSKKSFDDLHVKHQKFVKEFGTLHSKHKQQLSASHLYRGNGIVVVGGGTYSVMSMLLIRAITEQGINLPIEILIPPSEAEQEQEFCEYLNNNYNQFHSKCIYFDRVFPKDVIDRFEFKGYQYKSVAIVASSFENVLLLDADNVPVMNISTIFDSKPYKQYGFIMWPDYWRRTTNPKFYQIADQKIDFKNRTSNLIDNHTPPQIYMEQSKFSDIEYLQNFVPYHEFDGAIPDVSTESGQLIINKKTHLETILLSLYYNVYGPKYYYPLMSQGQSGQGDKETFIAAAHVLNQPYYQVKSGSGVEGYHKQDHSGFRGVAIYQKNFVEDYELNEFAAKNISSVYGETTTAEDSVQQDYDSRWNPFKDYIEPFFKNEQTKAGNMFAHCNLPKFDPIKMAANNEYTYEGEPFRVFKLKNTNGFDIEKSVFTAFDTHLCHQDSNFIAFQYLIDKIVDANEWNSMCNYIQKRLVFLQDSQNDI